jgi:hypothetical protein
MLQLSRANFINPYPRQREMMETAVAFAAHMGIALENLPASRQEKPGGPSKEE